MENKIVKKKEAWRVPLFPKYFKPIGITLFALPFVALLLFKYFQPAFYMDNKETIRLVIRNVSLLGMFFVACTRGKFEDEMTATFRLKAMGVAFVYAVLYTLVSPFIGLAWGDPVEIIKGNDVVFQMLFFYLVAFYSLKKRAG